MVSVVNVLVVRVLSWLTIKVKVERYGILWSVVKGCGISNGYVMV